MYRHLKSDHQQIQRNYLNIQRELFEYKKLLIVVTLEQIRASLGKTMV